MSGLTEDEKKIIFWFKVGTASFVGNVALLIIHAIGAGWL